MKQMLHSDARPGSTNLIPWHQDLVVFFAELFFFGGDFLGTEDLNFHVMYTPEN